MTVKRKLFSIVFGELAMFILVIGVAAVSLIPVIRLNSEFSEFSELAEQVMVTRHSIDALLISQTELQYYKVQEDMEALVQQFATVAGQTELKAINENVEKAIQTVLQLETVINIDWERLEPVLLKLMDQTEAVLSSRVVELTELYHVDMYDDEGDFNMIVETTDDLVYNISVIDRALSSAFDQLNAQDEIIRTEMSKKIAGILIRTAAVFAGFLIIIILVSSIIASKMARSIGALSSGVSRLRAGQLNTGFDTMSKDDIAVLGQDLNEFTAELSQSIQKIKNSSRSNLRMKNELSDAAERSQSSNEGITDAVSNIREGMVDLDERVAESGVAVNTVKTSTGELKGMLEEQTAMIEESTSSVTEMIASITNVSDITGRKKAATDELVKTAENGGERLEQTIGIIREITANVDEIRSTASIIQAVAAQTNLLAMNAAIEAAHAGEAGAGFSVVAEEIRKLAEASGISSKKISAVLKEVVQSIESAAVAGDETKMAFSEINREVVDVAGALMEISLSMDELSAGGSQILSAMNSLQGFASGVKEGGDAMTDAAASLEDAFRVVERVTSGVLAQIGGIGSRIEEISSATAIVAGISGRLSTEVERLETEVERFVIDEEVAGEE